MIKAVFLDLYNTVVRFHPPREEQQVTALADFGIEVATETICRSLAAADSWWYQENTSSPVEQRLDEEKRALYAQYETMILKGAGIEVTPEILGKIMLRLRQFDAKMVLFDDVIPALRSLKERGLVLGLLSNIHRDLDRLCAGLGIAPYLDFTITSQEVGAEKPHPPIFLAALERAKAKPAEAMHVGDQYQVDVLGARGVGIKGVLLDRAGLYEDVTDCPRITSLNEVLNHL